VDRGFVVGGGMVILTLDSRFGTTPKSWKIRRVCASLSTTPSLLSFVTGIVKAQLRTMRSVVPGLSPARALISAALAAKSGSAAMQS